MDRPLAWSSRPTLSVYSSRPSTSASSRPSSSTSSRPSSSTSSRPSSSTSSSPSSNDSTRPSSSAYSRPSSSAYSRPSSSASVGPSSLRITPKRRDILPEEEGPVCPDKTCLPTIFIGSISGRYTRNVWKKDRDSVKTYYRQSRKYVHGTFSQSDGAIGAIAKFVDKFVKIGYTGVRIVYSGKVKSLGNDDNRLMFDTGRDLSVRGLVNFIMAKGMSLELVIVSLNSFVWADVLGLKLRPDKTLTVYYPPYLLPTNLEDSSVEMFNKEGTKSFKTWEFFKATYKAE